MMNLHNTQTRGNDRDKHQGSQLVHNSHSNM